MAAATARGTGFETSTPSTAPPYSFSKLWARSAIATLKGYSQPQRYITGQSTRFAICGPSWRRNARSLQQGPDLEGIRGPEGGRGNAAKRLHALVQHRCSGALLTIKPEVKGRRGLGGAPRAGRGPGVQAGGGGAAR